MTEAWSAIPEFWRGVVASILGALVFAAICFVAKIFFSSAREFFRSRSIQINLLESRLASASPVVRSDAETEVLFKTVKWMIIGFVFWQLPLVIPQNYLWFWGTRLASTGCIVTALWIISLRAFPSHPDSPKLEKMLIEGQWMLMYRPPVGKKMLEFLDDGNFGEGRNDNESSWRVVNNLLEIFQSDGNLHSRFVFDPVSEVFLSTNDGDTRNVRNQFISSHSDLNS